MRKKTMMKTMEESSNRKGKEESKQSMTNPEKKETRLS